MKKWAWIISLQLLAFGVGFMGASWAVWYSGPDDFSTVMAAMMQKFGICMAVWFGAEALWEGVKWAFTSAHKGYEEGM